MPTPHSAFRLSDETRANLAKIAELYETDMTNAIRRMTDALAPLANLTTGMQGDRYSFDAFIEAQMAYRLGMDMQPGDILDSRTVNAIDLAITAANRHLAAGEREHTITLAVKELRKAGMGETFISEFAQALREED